MFEYDETTALFKKISVLSKTKIPDYFTWDMDMTKGTEN